LRILIINFILTIVFLEPRPKSQLVATIDPVGKTNRSKKRTLEYDDDEDEVENTPVLKRQSTSSSTGFEPIKSNKPSVIDNEELDFLIDKFF
jgi:hypothetical protein